MANKLKKMEIEQNENNINTENWLFNCQFGNLTIVSEIMKNEVCIRTIQICLGLLLSLQWSEKLKIANRSSN